MTFGDIITTILFIGPIILASIPLVREVIEKVDLPEKTIFQGRKQKSFFERITGPGWLFIGVAFLSLISAFFNEKRQAKEKMEFNSKQDSMRGEIRELKYIIDTLSDFSYDNISNGFGVSAVLLIGDNSARRLKYIFDSGESLTKNRISLYLDHSSNLVFTVVDNLGVPYSVRAVSNFITFKPGAAFNGDIRLF